MRLLRVTNSVEILQFLDRVGAFLHRWGLHRVSRLGAWVSRRILGDCFSIRADGFRIYTSFETRGFLYLMKAGTFEAFTVQLFKETMRRGMVVLDIGAQIGYYTLLGSRQVGDEGKVLGFEPDPRSFELLVRNVRENQCSYNTLLIPKAVADRPGQETFYLRRNTGTSGLYLLDGEDKPEGAISVECITVDQFLEDQPVDVIKMDIEGAEPKALRGMKRTLRRNPNVKLFIELNPPALRAADSSPRELVNSLNSHFHNVLVIDEQQRTLIPLEQVLTRICNLHCWGVRI